MLAFKSHDCGTTKKKVRMEQRISPEAKALIEEAARLQGVDLSEYVIASSVTAARETIAKLGTTVLQPEDQAAFLRAFEDEEPSRELKDVFVLQAEGAAPDGR